MWYRVKTIKSHVTALLMYFVLAGWEQTLYLTPVLSLLRERRFSFAQKQGRGWWLACHVWDKDNHLNVSCLLLTVVFTARCMSAVCLLVYTSYTAAYLTVLLHSQHLHLSVPLNSITTWTRWMCSTVFDYTCILIIVFLFQLQHPVRWKNLGCSERD